MRGRSGAAPRVFVGVLRLGLEVRGAHTLKDRRQAVLSVRDRIRSRFEVSAHELETGEDPQRHTLIVTTAGGDAQRVRAVLDQCAAVARDHAVAQAAQVDVDVFRWHHDGEDWAARMMAELGSPESADE